MTDINQFIGSIDLTVAETMQLINKNSYGILFLTDESNKLFGCITDGDIRRFLLGGGKLEDAAKDVANTHPRTAKNYDEAHALYHQKNYVVVPIVDEVGHVEDMYCGPQSDEDISYNALNIPVVINAGGRGTRLEPFTKVLPKPLIPIGDLPIVEIIMKEYQKYSCNDFHIILNYKRDLIKAYFNDCEGSYSISWYDENEPLGTGGGLCLLKGKLNETFFFANCDELLTADYAKIVDFHKSNNNVITMVGAYKNIKIPYGVVEIGENGVVENMKEKPLISFLTNTGVYIVEPEVLDGIEDNVPVSFPDIIEKEIKKGNRVAVYPISENDWMDMGQISELVKMREKLLGER